MHRRDMIKNLFTRKLNSREPAHNVVQQDQMQVNQPPDTAICYKSKWHLPGATFTKDIWLQHPQDWWLINGELQCIANEADEMVHVATHQLTSDKKSFAATLVFRFMNKFAEGEEDSFAAFKFGIREKAEGAAPDGNKVHMVAGITRGGYLFIDKTIGDRKIEGRILTESISLALTVIQQSTGLYFAKLRALDKAGNTLAALSSTEFDAMGWQGTIALVCNCRNNKGVTNKPSVAFSCFEIEGEKLTYASL